MRSHSNGDTESQCPSLTARKASFAGIGLHLIEFLSEGYHGDSSPPKKNKADAGT